VKLTGELPRERDRFRSHIHSLPPGSLDVAWVLRV
jgi:hypothetical protein